MNSESKTTENILREMREYADRLDNDGDITGADFRDFANQIEQAIARDTLCLSDGSLVIVRSAEIRVRLAQLDAEYIGYKNMVEMYKVLGWLRKTIGEWSMSDAPIQYCQYCNAVDNIDATLATPPRNCDVGSAQEQYVRFKRFCGSKSCDCLDCPLRECKHYDKFAWAQLPYEKEEGAE